jgi:phosphosulfolactate synthase
MAQHTSPAGPESLAEHLGITLYDRPGKPRDVGMSMVIDLALPADYVQSGLAAFGQYIDLVKLVDLHLTWPAEEVRRKISMYREHDILVEPGGVIVEIGRAQAKEFDAQVAMLKTLAQLGFNALEISATTRAADRVQEIDLVNAARDLGFTVYGEVGQKFAQGDPTRLTEDTLDREATLREMNILLEAGCSHVVWEGHVLRKVFGTEPSEILARGISGREQVLPIVEAIGQDKLLFEVSSLIPFESRRALQFWLIHLFGPTVNIGNVRFEEVPFLEHTRRGTWPIFGLGELGNHPWIHALQSGRPDADWWTMAELEGV